MLVRASQQAGQHFGRRRLFSNGAHPALQPGDFRFEAEVLGAERRQIARRSQQGLDGGDALRKPALQRTQGPQGHPFDGLQVPAQVENQESAGDQDKGQGEQRPRRGAVHAAPPTDASAARFEWKARREGRAGRGGSRDDIDHPALRLSPTRKRALFSISSRTMPVPRTTHVIGSSAIHTRIFRSLDSRSARFCSWEPPPHRQMPISIRSATSSGGTSSKASLLVSTITRTEAASPSRIPPAAPSPASGKPETRLRPRTIVVFSSLRGKAEPIVIFTRSAIRSPMSRLYLLRM